MASRISTILPLLLITLFCVGGVEAFYQLVENFLLVPAKVESVEQEQPLASAVSRVPPRVRSRVDYGIILKRNLFGAPPEPKKAEDEELPDTNEDLEATTLEIVLMGTVEGEDGHSRAIILNKKDRKQELYKTGDDIQGASIKEILRGKVILTYRGNDEMLDMSEASQYAPKNTISRPISVNRTPRNRRQVSAPNVPDKEETITSPTKRPRPVRPRRRLAPSSGPAGGEELDFGEAIRQSLEKEGLSEQEEDLEEFFLNQ